MKLHLNKIAFWDTDLDRMDETLHADFIITRVFQYGLLDDIKAVIRFYTPNQIKKAFATQRGIDKKAIALARVLDLT